MIISNFLLSRTSDQATVLNSDGSVVISTAPVQQPGVHVHEIIDPSASDNAFTGIIKKYIAKIPARVSWNKKTAYIKKRQQNQRCCV